MVLIFSAIFGMGFSASRPCRVSSFNQFEYVGHAAPVRRLSRPWGGPGLSVSMARPERSFQRACRESLNNSKRYAGNDSACEGRVNAKSMRFSGKYALFFRVSLACVCFFPGNHLIISHILMVWLAIPIFYLDVCSVRTVLLGFKKNII